MSDLIEFLSAYIDFMEWLNEWGDEEKRKSKSREYRDGYQDAISDAYDRANALLPEWAKLSKVVPEKVSP